MTSTNICFMSISSDNVLFDFDMMVRKTMRNLNISDQAFMEKLRDYISVKHPNLNTIEHSVLVSGFIMRPNNFEKFTEFLDVIGATMTFNVMNEDVNKQADVKSHHHKGPVVEKTNTLTLASSLVYLGLNRQLLSYMSDIACVTITDVMERGQEKLRQSLRDRDFETLVKKMAEHGFPIPAESTQM